MGMSLQGFGLGCAALVAAGAVWVTLGFRETQELREQLSAASRPAADREAFVIRRDELADKMEDLQSWQRLEDSVGERDRLRADVKRLQAELARQNIPAKPKPIPATPEQTKWRNAGRGSPAAAFETVLHALSRSDVDALSALIAFDENARREADRMYALLPEDMRADYTSPEDVVAALMAVNTRLNFDKVKALEEAETSANHKTLRVSVGWDRLPGRSNDFALRFRRDAANWKLLVPALIVDGYRHMLLGTVTESVPQQ